MKRQDRDIKAERGREVDRGRDKTGRERERDREKRKKEGDRERQRHDTPYY